MEKEFYEKIWKKHQKKADSELWKKFDLKVLDIIIPFFKNKCLDVGCGNGYITDALAELGHTEGMDISSIAIKEARDKYPSLLFTQGSVEKMPFLDDSFSCIFAGQIIEHVVDTDRMFSEFHRVLKSNGNLIITTPEFSWLKRVLIAMFKWDEFLNSSGEHIRFYSENMMRKILEKHGFEVIFKTSTGGILPSSMVVIGVKK